MEPARTLIIPLPSLSAAAVVKDLKVAKKVKWEKLAVHTMDEVRFIPFHDILYCNSQVNYTRVHTRDGKSFYAPKP